MEIAIIMMGSSLLVMASTLLFISIRMLRMKRRIKKLSVALAKVESLIMSSKQDDTDSDVHKENFIKFLSDSRDWAYEYIENVQKGLNDFVSAVDADISYFDSYGDVLSMSRPDYAAMSNISKEYKELKKLLPIEENK